MQMQIIDLVKGDLIYLLFIVGTGKVPGHNKHRAAIANRGRSTIFPPGTTHGPGRTPALSISGGRSWRSVCTPLKSPVAVCARIVRARRVRVDRVALVAELLHALRVGAQAQHDPVGPFGAPGGAWTGGQAV